MAFRFFLFFAVFTAFANENISDSLKLGCAEGVPVSEIRLEGLKHTRARVVSRELIHREAFPFSSIDWMKEKRKLESLDIFSHIELVCSKTDSGQILNYRFTELFYWIPSPSTKKTDQDGWMLGLAFAHLNIAGEDIRAEIQYRTSVDPWMDANEFAFYAEAPWLWDMDVGWALDLVRTDSWDNLRNYQEKSWYAHLDLKKGLGSSFYGITAFSYRYLENFGYTPDIGIGLLWDSRDSEMDARRGFYSEWRFTQFGGIFNSHQNYREYLTDQRWYGSFARFISGVSILGRFRPGDQKFYDRLHQGGANTLRGFDPDSSIHGRHEIIWNAEERIVLLERTPFSFFGVNLFWGIQAVVGIDGSFLWDARSFPAWENYRSAVYGGLHILIPALSRIRFEVGYSPDTKEPKFTIGLFEKLDTERWLSR